MGTACSVPPALVSIAGLYAAVCRLPSPLPDAETLLSELCAAFPDAASRSYLAALGEGANAAVRLYALSLLPPLLLTAGRTPKDYSLRRNGNGRPFLAPSDTFACPADFNLSHSAAHAVCLLWTGGGLVGVDVEEPVPDGRAHRLAERFFSQGEKQRLCSAGKDAFAAEFTRLWTCREALAKQDGKGQPLRFDAVKPPEGVRLFSFTLPDTGAALTVCLPAQQQA